MGTRRKRISGYKTRRVPAKSNMAIGKIEENNTYPSKAIVDYFGSECMCLCVIKKINGNAVHAHKRHFSNRRLTGSFFGSLLTNRGARGCPRCPADRSCVRSRRRWSPGRRAALAGKKIHSRCSFCAFVADARRKLKLNKKTRDFYELENSGSARRYWRQSFEYERSHTAFSSSSSSSEMSLPEH